MELTLVNRPTFEPYQGPFNIPVLIDDIKQLARYLPQEESYAKAEQDFEMARCTYFTIRADQSKDDWVAILRNSNIPFLLFGAIPVLHRPDLENTTFSSTESIDSLFDAIEDIEGLVVETSHIWLPNSIVVGALETSTSQNNSRGEVLRVSYSLFHLALRFLEGSITEKTFLEACTSLTDKQDSPISLSNSETSVFQKWSKEQVQQAVDNYNKQREDKNRGVLQYFNEKGDKMPG